MSDTFNPASASAPRLASVCSDMQVLSGSAPTCVSCTPLMMALFPMNSFRLRSKTDAHIALQTANFLDRTTNQIGHDVARRAPRLQHAARLAGDVVEQVVPAGGQRRRQKIFHQDALVRRLQRRQPGLGPGLRDLAVEGPDGLAGPDLADAEGLGVRRDDLVLAG